MHLQASTPGWLDAVLKLPDGGLVKSVGDPSLLRDAKQAWAAAGRDPRKLVTVYRHYDVETAPPGTWEQAKAHWRAMFRRWVDDTYRREYAAFVDVVSESNEYTATSTWADPFARAAALQNMRAAVYVWNSEFRGVLVPAHARLALLAGPVGNDFPRDVLELAVLEDAIVDYHAYTRWDRGARDAGDWRWHSGRWEALEQEHGLKPNWLWGECGPYAGVAEGWRHPLCLGGDAGLLVRAYQNWYADIQRTAAYREGRIVGTGAWFTTGHVGWEWYQMDAAELCAVADAIRPLWQPGQQEGDQMNAELVRQKLAEIRAACDAIEAELPEPPWWESVEPGAVVRQAGTSLKLYNAPGGTVNRTVNATWDIIVRQRAGEWLRVTDGSASDPDGLWVLAGDVRLA